jgi:hypothetical protein
MDSRFDDLLNTVIVEKGQGIYGFFDVVMGFMYRRTDFFYEMAPGENMGFFPGQNEAIIYNYFRKYQNLHYKERVPKRNIDPKEIEDFMKKQKELKEKGGNKITSDISKEKDTTTDKEISNTVTTSNTSTSITSEDKEIKKEEPIKLDNNVKTTTIAEPKKKELNPTATSISTYNGDSCENYNWSQGVIDVTIQINLPPNTKKQMVYIIYNLYS